MESRTRIRSAVQRTPNARETRPITAFLPLRGTSYLDRQRKRIHSAPARLTQVKHVARHVVNSARGSNTLYAYFTLVVDDSCVPSALVLAWALRRSGTRYDLVAMVTDNLSLRMIRSLRHLYTRVECVDSISSSCHERKMCGLFLRHDRNQYLFAMTKGNLFKFTEYVKILYVDVSMLPLGNMDDLFRLEPPAGVLSLLRDHEQNYWHGQKLKKEQVVKAIELSRGILGCVLLLSPSLNTYAAFQTRRTKTRHIHIIYPDEEFLTALFMNEWTHIHRKYATVPWHSGDESPIAIRFMHTKPWEDTVNPAPGVKLWRQRAMDLVKSYPQLRLCFKRFSWFTTALAFTEDETDDS